MYKKRGYKSFCTALIGGGMGVLLVFFVSLKQYSIDKDYLNMIFLFSLSMLFIIPGILIIRWARKNGKK